MGRYREGREHQPGAVKQKGPQGPFFFFGGELPVGEMWIGKKLAGKKLARKKGAAKMRPEKNLLGKI